MNKPERQTKPRDPRRRRELPPNVVPIRSFLEVQRLMRRLDMTPAECLDLLAGALADLERQVTEYDDQLGFDHPAWTVGKRA